MLLRQIQMNHRMVAPLLIAGVLGAALVAPLDAAAAPAAREFANCTAMHKVYPHGVGRRHAHDHVTSGAPVTNFKRNNALYNANAGSDRDHDHVACEAH